MLFTNGNQLNLYSADITDDVGGKYVRTTSCNGVVMWSEQVGDHYKTVLCPLRAYEKVCGTSQIHWSVQGDPIPYCYDSRVRKALGLSY